MENIPKLVSERLKTAQPKSHPDPDLLTAFAEHSLKGQERGQLLEHLAACADCREVVALAQPQWPEVAVAVASPKRFARLSLPVLRWGTAAALVVIVGSAIVLRQQHKPTPASSVAPVQIESRIPAPQVSKDDDRALSSIPQQSAKDELRATAESRPDTAVLSKSNVRSKQLVNDKKIAEFASEPGIAANEVKAEPQTTAAAPPPAQNRTGQAAQQPGDRIASAAQSVEVTAAAPMITTSEAEVSKAKEPPKTAKEKSFVAANAMVARRTNGAADTRLAPTGRSYFQLKELVPPFPRWTLSADGALERSVDSGKTWEKVTVEEGAVFRAVSAVGPEVWAGGSAGLLYHSADAGLHWMRIKPTANNATLTGDIAGIEFTDNQHGKLTTTDGQVWDTTNTGQSWEKH